MGLTFSVSICEMFIIGLDRAVVAFEQYWDFEIEGGGSETSFNPWNASGFTSLDFNRSNTYTLLTY